MQRIDDYKVDGAERDERTTLNVDRDVVWQSASEHQGTKRSRKWCRHLLARSPACSNVIGMREF